MYAKQVKIENETGLHARPASDFVNLAKNYASQITIQNMDEEDSRKANAKSIVMLIAEGLCSAEGEDEQAAVEDLVALIKTKFGEE